MMLSCFSPVRSVTCKRYRHVHACHFLFYTAAMKTLSRFHAYLNVVGSAKLKRIADPIKRHLVYNMTPFQQINIHVYRLSSPPYLRESGIESAAHRTGGLHAADRYQRAQPGIIAGHAPYHTPGFHGQGMVLCYDVMRCRARLLQRTI